MATRQLPSSIALCGPSSEVQRADLGGIEFGLVVNGEVSSASRFLTLTGCHPASLTPENRARYTCCPSPTITGWHYICNPPATSSIR